MKYTQTINDVVNGGYCVGCGGCAVKNSSIQMKMNAEGQYLPESMSTKEFNSLENGKYCPFISVVNEDALADEFLDLNDQVSHKRHVGYVSSSWAGYVDSGEYRKNGSSGGMVSWIATKLYEQGEIDALIHVKISSKKGILFEYGVSNSIKEIQEGAKSRYYPVKLDEVISIVLSDHSKKYAIVGLPCMIKSIRLMMFDDQRLRNSIKFCIGIVCGHLKTAGYAELLAWQQGNSPEILETVDFRRKLKFRSASSYGFLSKNKDGVRKVTPMESLYGGDWGQGQLKLSACDYCDDVFAETADIVIGDAWLPKYKKDSRGTNIIVSRNKIISKLIEDGRTKGLLKLDNITDEDAFQSQSSGIKHRTEGLSHRLKIKSSLGLSAPMKRIHAKEIPISTNRADIYEMRELIRDETVKSFKLAKQKNDLKLYINHIKPLIFSYNSLQFVPRKLQIYRNARKIIVKFIRKCTRTYNKEIYPEK
jgi:coenzyme F420 hydrogenase subunit beta